MNLFSSVLSMENGVNVLQWMENNEITAPSHWSILKIWLHQSDYIKCFCNKAPHMSLMYSVLLPSSMIRVVIHIQKRSKKIARAVTLTKREISSLTAKEVRRITRCGRYGMWLEVAQVGKFTR